MASQIDSWYPAESPILIGVLNGAVVFHDRADAGDDCPGHIDFMAVSSYGSSTQSSGVVQILKDLSVSIEGRDVLVVEDIVDSGLTLQYLLDFLERRNPKSLRVVALLRKVKSSAPGGSGRSGRVRDSRRIRYWIRAGLRWSLPESSLYRRFVTRRNYGKLSGCYTARKS